MVLTLLIVGATAVVVTALVTGWDIHALAEYSNGAVRLSLSPDYEKEKESKQRSTSNLYLCFILHSNDSRPFYLFNVDMFDF